MFVRSLSLVTWWLQPHGLLIHSYLPCPTASYPACPALITGSESILSSHWLDPGHASSSWQTTHTQHAVKETNGSLCGYFWRADTPPGRLRLPRDTTDASQVFRSVACLLCTRLMFLRCFVWSSNTHTHTQALINYDHSYSEFLCPLLIYETDNVRRTFIKRERLCGCMSHDVTRQAQRCTETSERCEAFSGNSLLNKCQVLEGVLLSSRVLPALSVQCSVCDLRSSSSSWNTCKVDSFKYF